METLQDGMSISKQEIWIAIGALVTAISCLVSAIVFIFMQLDKRTKEFVEVTKDNKHALEDVKSALDGNTKVIQDLPHNIMLEIKAFRQK